MVKVYKIKKDVISVTLKGKSYTKADKKSFSTKDFDAKLLESAHKAGFFDLVKTKEAKAKEAKSKEAKA